jgi:predicted ATPase
VLQDWCLAAEPPRLASPVVSRPNAGRGIVDVMSPRRRTASPRRAAGAPFLHRLVSQPDPTEQPKYPFNVRAFSHGIDVAFRSRVTFFVGENGSGKSTLLEAIAECCGFNPEGGNRDHHRAVFAERSPFAQTLRLSWLPKVTEGFFMRAESFYNFATYIEGVSDLRAYGGKSLHQQSHGESFISLFANRFEQGIYILDEPEAALSPQRQLTFLKIIHDLTTPGHAQFLVATHSPIILSYPGAVLFSLDGDAIQEIDYRETKHFLITRDFLNSPERFFKHLFNASEETEPDA